VRVSRFGGWLRDHSGETVNIEIGEADPDGEAYNAIYAKLPGVTLTRLLGGEGHRPRNALPLWCRWRASKVAPV
jgi:hypothetical protein